MTDNTAAGPKPDPSDILEHRLARLAPIDAARVVNSYAPIRIEGTFVTGQTFHVRFGHAAATMSVSAPAERPTSDGARTERVPCSAAHVDYETIDFLTRCVADLLVKHDLLGVSENMPQGHVRDVPTGFSRHDYAGPRTQAIHTDGGTVEVTVGYMDAAGRHVIDVHVTPFDGPVPHGPDAGSLWHLQHTDNGYQLVCTPPAASDANAPRAAATPEP